MAAKPGVFSASSASWMKLGVQNLNETLLLVKDPYGSADVHFVCSCAKNDDFHRDVIKFDKAVSISLESKKPLASVDPINLEAKLPIKPSRTSPAPQTPQVEAPATPPSAKPFSFKAFSSGLKTDQSDLSTPLSVNNRNSERSLKSSTISGYQWKNLTWNTPEFPNLSIKLLSLGQRTTASSVSVEFNPPLECSLTIRKRVQAWFVGLTLAEGCSVVGMGGQNLRGRIRRTVPSNGFVYCSKDTRIILEDVSAPSSSTERFDLVHEQLLSNIPQLNFIIGRFLHTASSSFDNLPFPKGILFHGPPGTGKSHSVRQLVQCLMALKVPVYFKAPQPGDFRSKTGGDLVLKEIFHDARKHLRDHPTGISIIFLDELDSYTGKRSETPQGGHTGMLLTLMDGIQSKTGVNRLIVIGATNHIDVIDPAMRRPGRFDKEILFRLPSKEDRYKLVTELLPSTNARRLQLAEICRDQCVGYSQADIVSWLRCTQDESSVDSLSVPKASALRDAIHFMDETKPIEIGGQEDAKRSLQMAIEWPITRRDVLDRFGLSTLFRGILLYGPPGCAKTSLVRSIAWSNRGAASFYSLSGADVYSSGLGEAEACIRRAFARARATAPSILFFDEIDSLVGNRDTTSSSGATDSVQGRVLSTFLNEMDGVDTFTTDMVIVVGATNCPENIDQALLRPGRFDPLIFVGPPDPRSVLDLELGKMQLKDDVNISSLVAECAYMSGADISGACRLAALRALGRGPLELPSEADFVIALRQATRSCRPDVIKRYVDFKEGKKETA